MQSATISFVCKAHHICDRGGHILLTKCFCQKIEKGRGKEIEYEQGILETIDESTRNSLGALKSFDV